jgi:anti-sigma factor RsiW
MSGQHLSDEAVAAFADGVLRGGARERASRHVAACPECAHAVAAQREAVWALRAAPAPPLPTDLLDRLRSVPVTTPIEQRPAGIPSAVTRDGSALFSALGGLTAAAFAPSGSEAKGAHSHGPRSQHADSQGTDSHDAVQRGLRARLRWGR